MAKDLPNVPQRSPVSILTPELVDAQGRSDREFLTHRVRLLLDAKEKHPSVSFQDLAHLTDLTGCGCGCCCCCKTLVLPGEYVTLPQ